MTTLETLRLADYLTWLDVHFAQAMTRIGNDSRPQVVLAAALVSRAVRESHVCLDLPRLAGDDVVRDSEGTIISSRPWPTLNEWRDILQSSSLVDAGAGSAPLVIDAADRLYLRRYWEHEQQLAQALRTRAGWVDAEVDPVWLRATLDRIFPADDRAAGEIDWQRLAALVAAQRRLCVISGGPGTGKTYTVVKILAVLVELAAQRAARPPRILLVAPTGKAAARLAESIRNTKLLLNADDAVKAAIPTEAATIHRCLGSLGGSATRFRHGIKNPLPADVVLVDEASMVDLGLMARLVAALPSAARLILLGDQDQLASVEAGAVLGDICNTGGARSYSKALASMVRKVTGERLPLSAAAPEATGIWDCIVQLTRSYRYRDDSSIGALARAINRGDADTALAVLGGNDAAVARIEPAADWESTAQLRDAILGGFGEYLRETEPSEQLHRLERFRILCAHRRGASGVETMNELAEQTLGDAGLLVLDGAAYLGRPIMVSRNDYQVRLFNGDVGVVTCDPADRGGRLVVVEGERNQLRWLAPSRLPPHETVFAMSIHKSQGSELDEVAVILPQRDSPVLTRELLYTAVTRARHRVTVHASAEIIRLAIGRRVDRASGLRDQLWG